MFLFFSFYSHIYIYLPLHMRGGIYTVGKDIKLDPNVPLAWRFKTYRVLRAGID